MLIQQTRCRNKYCRRFIVIDIDSDAEFVATASCCCCDIATTNLLYGHGWGARDKHYHGHDAMCN